MAWLHNLIRSTGTPNHQLITRLESRGPRLLVWTRSRVYRLRRGKLRLWKKL